LQNKFLTSQAICYDTWQATLCTCLFERKVRFTRNTGKLIKAEYDKD